MDDNERAVRIEHIAMVRGNCRDYVLGTLILIAFLSYLGCYWAAIIVAALSGIKIWRGKPFSIGDDLWPLAPEE